MTVQFINHPDGSPQFAVIPYREYRKLLQEKTELLAKKGYYDGCRSLDREVDSAEPLLSADGCFITLPNGRGARLDLRQFIAVWLKSRPSMTMMVNRRNRAYSTFEGEERNTLDPIIRRCFLPPDSPYLNTVQATTAVVEALLQTGIFTEERKSLPGYYRPVKCIVMNEQKARDFFITHSPAEVEIDQDVFTLRDST